MKDQTKDEPCSVDVARPRFLLRRYDSVSGSSDSSSRSSTSRGSFAQSPSRQQDPIGRRTRTNTFNSNYENGDESSSRTKHTNQRERSNGITDLDISDNSCMLCDTLVYERQYYLWNSQYTKSSLCSRCSFDSDGMRYISYWGTPSYQSGSWRKRYNAGRGIDIDLTPLLEVLERIDQIDTSVDGRKSKRVDYISEDIPDDLGNTESKVSYELTERRRRRQANRSVIEDFDDLNNNIKTNDHSDNHRLSKQSNDNSENTDTYFNTNTEQKVKECHVTEICTNTEEIDEIEPLQVIKMTEQLLVQTTLHQDHTDSENFTTPKGNEESITPGFNNNSMSTENLQEYIQKRRKSNYEEFLAGLEPTSQFHRRSSAAEDVKCYNKIKQKRNKETGRKMNCERNNQSTTTKATKKSSEDVHGEGKENKVIDNGQFNVCQRKKADLECEKTEDLKPARKVKYIRPKYKYKPTRRNTPFMEENEFPLKPANLCDSKKLSEGYEVGSSNQECGEKSIPPTNASTGKNASTDNSISDEATFADIKQRFEKLSNSKTSVQQSNEMSQPDKLSKGHFRSKYVESIGDITNFSSDKGLKFDDNNTTRILKQQNDVKRNEYPQSSESENVTPESDFTDDRSASEDRYNLIRYQNKENETPANLEVGNERNDLACIKSNMDACDNFRLSANSKNQLKHIRQDEAGEEETNLQDLLKGCAAEEKNDGNETKTSEFSSCNNSLSDSIKKQFEDRNYPESDIKHSKDSDDDFISDKSSSFDDSRLAKTVIESEHSCRSNARAKEMKYRVSENDIEHENPNIARIKRKLRRKQKYENEQDSNSDEMHDMITELNGSNDEEVELGWRSRGYNTDFYMSRRSVTGGEIIDRYKRALSNRRSKNNSRDASRRCSKNKNMMNMVDEIMTQSDSVSRSGTKLSKSPSLAHLSRTNTQMFNMKEFGPDNAVDYSNAIDSSSGVSAIALQAALNRAANCSKRMSERLRTQLSQQSDSYDSSS